MTNAETRRSRRRRLGRLALLAGGFVVALLIGEVAVRVFDLGPRPLIPLAVGAYRLSEHPALRFEYKPGYQRSFVEAGATAYDFSINDAGFRDVDIAVDKPDGVIRVLALGDSVTAGNGVALLADTYPKVLERLLNQGQQGRRFEVLNFGVGGYDTAQEAAMLALRGIDYEPDIVLLGFCLNDFWRNSDGGLYQTLLDANAGSGQEAVVISPSSSFVLRHSRLAFAIYHALGGVGESDHEPGDQAPQTFGEGHVADGLRHILELQEAHGFRCLTIIVPSFHAPFDKYEFRAVHEKFKAINAATARLPLVDLLDDFAATGLGSSELAVDGLHPNERGTRMMAEFVRDHLLDLYPDLAGGR